MQQQVCRRVVCMLKEIIGKREKRVKVKSCKKQAGSSVAMLLAVVGRRARARCAHARSKSTKEREGGHKRGRSPVLPGMSELRRERLQKLT